MKSSKYLFKSCHILTVFLILFFIFMSSSCSVSRENSLPKDFKSFSDNEKINWLIMTLSPDSIARFICDSEIKTDTIKLLSNFSESIRKIYNQYNDSSKIVFGLSLNEYAASLPAISKMQLYKIAAIDNPRQLGYLYAEDCRKNKVAEEKIIKELSALQRICANDSDYFFNFLKGMQVSKHITNF